MIEDDYDVDVRPQPDDGGLTWRAQLSLVAAMLVVSIAVWLATTPFEMPLNALYQLLYIAAVVLFVTSIAVGIRLGWRRDKKVSDR